jgi:hypothetical protein
MVFSQNASYFLPSLPKPAPSLVLIGLWRVRNESINGILATALIYVKAG